MSGAVRGVSFDVDGTLYSPRALGWTFFLRSFSHRGLLRTLRVGRAVREELRGRAFDTGAALLAEEARIAGERLDVMPGEARRRLDDAFDRVLCEVLEDKVRPTAGARAVRAALEGLVGHGLGIAAVSDRRVDDKLAALGLGDLPWAARVSADDTGVLKPDPAPFLAACRALGAPPAQCVHVGDRDDSDGAGSRAAGMRYVRVAGPEALPRAVAEILRGAPAP